MTIHEHNRHILEAAFGAEAGLVYQDRAFLFAALESGSWKRRYCAIQFLLDHWNLGQDVLWPLYKTHFENEQHLQVRLITLKQIGRLFSQTYHDNACRVLARIALSDQFENRIRRRAFESINEIRRPVAIDDQFNNQSVDELFVRFETLKQDLDEFLSKEFREELPDWDVGLLRELAAD